MWIKIWIVISKFDPSFCTHLVEVYKSETILRRFGVCASSEQIQKHWGKESLVTNKKHPICPNLIINPFKLTPTTKVNQEARDIKSVQFALLSHCTSAQPVSRVSKLAETNCYQGSARGLLISYRCLLLNQSKLQCTPSTHLLNLSITNSQRNEDRKNFGGKCFSENLFRGSLALEKSNFGHSKWVQYIKTKKPLSNWFRD